MLKRLLERQSPFRSGQMTGYARAFGQCIRLPRRLVRELGFLVIRGTSTRVRLYDIIFHFAVAPTPASVTKLEESLALLSKHDGVSLRRVRRELRYIVVGEKHAIGYSPDLRICVIGIAHVTEQSPARIAAAIVHEMTHARLWRRGHRYARAERGRIEAICVRAEAAFARRLPHGEDLARSIEASLGRPWW